MKNYFYNIIQIDFKLYVMRNSELMMFHGK